MCGRPAKALTSLLLATLLAGCGGDVPGLSAWREGRYEEARDRLAEAESAAGEDAPASITYNRALAALRAGDLSDAEAAAERAAGKDDPEVASLSDFLRGNAAYARCALAERQAGTVEAEPFALKIAIVYAEKARDFWRAAAASRTDWPEARRNVERALRKIEELSTRKREAESRKTPGPDPRPGPGSPPPPPPPNPEGEGSLEETEARPYELEIAPEQVLRLFERLAEKEKEKIELRRSRRGAPGTDREKDW